MSVDSKTIDDAPLVTAEEAAVIQYLRSLTAIRDRCHAVLSVVKEGRGVGFTLDNSKFQSTVEYVHRVIEANFPGGADTVPFHSRWRHFESGGIDRVNTILNPAWSEVDRREVARRKIDLAITSVLLDAGAGPDWKFTEEETGVVLGRSEGLGIASFHMFLSGAFSSDEAHPAQADSAGLKSLSPEAVNKYFQVSASNPLVGAEGRASLLRNLGHSIERNSKYFTRADSSIIRPGNLVDYLWDRADAEGNISVADLWEVVIVGLQHTWPPSRTKIGNVAMGDVWQYSPLPTAALLHRYADASPKVVSHTQLVPFHKLSQWLTYSLMEPLFESGLKIPDISPMTGLAEYRNGGLFVDSGLLVPKHASTLTDPIEPSSEIIIEWRACTVALLDDVATALRAKLGVDATSFPLVKMLEGGTWKAGRVIAKEKRAGGGPPINIVSDGTVF